MTATLARAALAADSDKAKASSADDLPGPPRHTGAGATSTETSSSIPAATTRVALVVATLGRSVEIVRLLDSLLTQTRLPDEVIFVDQNEDDRVGEAIAPYQDRLPIRQLRRPDMRGTSRARNVGWRASQSEIIIFPDDDCWYPSGFIARAVELVLETPADLVSGRAADETGRSINGRFETRAGWVGRHNIWTTQIEWMVAVRRSVLEATGGYDAAIGPGNAIGACEGQDFSLRALDAGFRQYFDPSLVGHHAEMRIDAPGPDVRRKARVYGRGMGHVLRKHGFGAREGAYWILRPVGRMVQNLCRLDARRAAYYGNVALGRCSGFLSR